MGGNLVVGMGSFLTTTLIIYTSVLSFTSTPGCMFLFVNSNVTLPRHVTTRRFSIGANNGGLRVGRLPCRTVAHAYSTSSLVASSTTTTATVTYNIGAHGNSLNISVGNGPIRSITRITGGDNHHINVTADVIVGRTAPNKFCTRHDGHSLRCRVNLSLIGSNFSFFTNNCVCGTKSAGSITCGNGVCSLTTGTNCGIVVRSGRAFTTLGGSNDGILCSTRTSNTVPITVGRRLRGGGCSALTRVARGNVRLLSGPGNFFFVVRNNLVSLTYRTGSTTAALRSIVTFGRTIYGTLRFRGGRPRSALVLIANSRRANNVALNFSTANCILCPRELERRGISSSCLGTSLGGTGTTTRGTNAP